LLPPWGRGKEGVFTPNEWPRVGVNNKEGVRPYNEQQRLRLFDMVIEFLRVEGLTAQCSYFVQAKVCGYP
jgi:hypothetical protein